MHTATGVKFTLPTSQSADADQKLKSLPSAANVLCTDYKEREALRAVLLF